MADYVATSQGRIGYGLPQPYIAIAAYKKRDVVQYQGGCYVVLLDGVTGITPVDDGVNYRLLCARGESGEGNAQWFTGVAVSGRESGIVAGVVGSKEGDMYLNRLTSDLYRASAPDTWEWVMNLGEAVNVQASNVPTSDGGNVQAALDELAARRAADIPVDEEGESVQTVLDTFAAAIVDLDARAAENIPTSAPGVSVQEALNNLAVEILATTLLQASWAQAEDAGIFEQSISNALFAAANYSYHMAVAPADIFAAADIGGIIMASVADGSAIFQCRKQPEADIAVQIKRTAWKEDA